ncbi:MAG: nucleoid-associated protein [Verrucomicrobia bacterium]|nr:nucleoid-associated protein [Verrucomicrobiota bacterium]
MALFTNFKEASLSAMTLAKVGNPLKGEVLHTSKTLCQVAEEDTEWLTHCFLRSFRALELHCLHHHSDLASNEMFSYASKIFEAPDTLLENGALIAKHLHSASNHPNIKNGDLCIGLIKGVKVAGQETDAISIIKSESKVPFLQITVDDGDLKLSTQQGIYPDKIDKGCLILNHNRDEGYAVYVFDKSGGNTYFWNRDFLGAIPVKDEDYLTRRYSELCVGFADEGLPENTPQEERHSLARKAASHLAEKEEFNRQEFEQEVLVEPEMIEQFANFKEEFEKEVDTPLDDQFKISKKIAKREEKKLKSRMKLDTGAVIRLSSALIEDCEGIVEQGYDEAKKMKFVKLFYNEEL